MLNNPIRWLQGRKFEHVSPDAGGVSYLIVVVVHDVGWFVWLQNQEKLMVAHGSSVRGQEVILCGDCLDARSRGFGAPVSHDLLWSIDLVLVSILFWISEYAGIYSV